MELNKKRLEISNIDKEIVNLLEKRFDIVMELGRYKMEKNLPIYDELREQLVVENCISHLQNKEYSKCIDDIYFQIMRSCKDIQNHMKSEEK